MWDMLNLVQCIQFLRMGGWIYRKKTVSVLYMLFLMCECVILSCEILIYPYWLVQFKLEKYTVTALHFSNRKGIIDINSNVQYITCATVWCVYEEELAWHDGPTTFSPAGKNHKQNMTNFVFLLFVYLPLLQSFESHIAVNMKIHN